MTVRIICYCAICHRMTAHTNGRRGFVCRTCRGDWKRAQKKRKKNGKEDDGHHGRLGA